MFGEHDRKVRWRIIVEPHFSRNGSGKHLFQLNCTYEVGSPIYRISQKDTHIIIRNINLVYTSF
jgi:hypothetical protein